MEGTACLSELERCLSKKSMHSFDKAIELTPVSQDRFRGKTSLEYENTVGPFGGITNALLLRAIELHDQSFGEPLALTVNFAGAIAPGDFEIQVAPTRSNRSTQHWSGSLTQQDEVQATATAVFAKRRDTWSSNKAASFEGVPSPDSLPRAATVGAPPWFSRYDMRFVDGGMDTMKGREQPDSVTRMWVRDEPPRPVTFSSLASMCDGFFPRIFLRLGRVLPIGTVSMTTYFHAGSAQLQAHGDRHLFGISRGGNFRNGYFDETVEIWSHAGDLLATSHQIVYFRT